jgi:hypothetical protein
MSDDETPSPQDVPDAGEAPQRNEAPEAPEAPQRNDAWDDIERQLAEFGQRMADLVRSAIDDPETRRHAREVKVRLEDMAGRIGDAVDSAVSSAEVSGARERVGEAAETVVSASRRAAGEAAPHVASALLVANEMLQGVVDRFDDRAPAVTTPPDEDEGTVARQGDDPAAAAGEPTGDAEGPAEG